MEADGLLGPDEVETIARYFRERGVKLVLIRPKGSSSALIAKTDLGGAAEIRGRCPELNVGGRRLTTTLVSGSIGKLKRRAEKGGAR